MRKNNSEIHQKQNERLSFIDFCANFLGVVSRVDLMKRFGISDGSASKDLSSYIKLAPDNLKYDFRSKSHYTTKQFKPLFDFPVTQALKALSTGFGDTLEQTRTPFIVAEAAIELNKPKSENVAQISRAINLRKVVEIKYKSLSSGETKRKISPFAIINSGLRWHVRAFDRKSAEFRDFVFARMLSATQIDDNQDENELPENDASWNQQITLVLAPHPSNVSEKDSIQMDYGMENGVLTVTVRKAVAGYVLRQWNVDCTKDHALDRKHFQLWLKNRDSIDCIDEIILAPGIEPR